MSLGRQVKYGLAKEATAGTGVAPTNWVNQLAFDFNPMSEYAVNNSAWGRIERTNSADVLRNWAEGSLEAKLNSDTSGLILLGAFGSVASAANADASGSVYDHTFTINQDIDGQTLTLTRKDDVSVLQHALARVGEWSLSMELGDYVRFTSQVIAKKGTTTTATAAYAEETEFLPKHISVKTASTKAGLSGASDVSKVESLTLNVNPNLEPDWESGNSAPFGFSSRGYELNFEMTKRYEDTTYEDAFNNGTELAFELTAENTDVTIGTAANPGLVFTAAKFNVTDWTRNEELDSPVSETLTGTIHFDVDDSAALTGVLTNTTASY